jgi:hypothetical protein
MINQFTSLFIIVILLTIVVMYKYSSYTDKMQKMLGGMWISDPSFLEESGLNSFYMYIDGDIGSSGFSAGCLRSGYIVATNGSGFIINDPVDIIVKKLYTEGDTEHYEFLFKNINYEFFPNKQKAKFYPICNKLVMYNGDTITAVLYKNLIQTEQIFIKNEIKNSTSNQNNFKRGDEKVENYESENYESENYENENYENENDVESL